MSEPRVSNATASRSIDTLYVETSALLRVILEGDATLRPVLKGAKRLMTSSLTGVEADRGIRRAGADNRLTSVQQRKARRSLNAFLASCEIVALDESVLQQVLQDFPVEPVRTLDALHLASVQLIADAVESTAVASYDKRVRENAEAWGYTVLP